MADIVQTRGLCKQYGMSDAFGVMGLAKTQDQYLSGRTVLNCSEDTAAEIDREVLRIVKEAHEKARGILSSHRAILDEAAAFLLQRETITGEEFMRIVRKHTAAE